MPKQIVVAYIVHTTSCILVQLTSMDLLKGASGDLCTSLASTAKEIHLQYVNHTCVTPLLACRLIVQDKNLGIGPIRMGDTA